jgi:chorismate mutase
MAGTHVFQAVQHPELDAQSLVAIRDVLKKRARYLRLVAQIKEADCVNVTSSTVAA